MPKARTFYVLDMGFVYKISRADFIEYLKKVATQDYTPISGQGFKRLGVVTNITDLESVDAVYLLEEIQRGER